MRIQRAEDEPSDIGTMNTSERLIVFALMPEEAAATWSTLRHILAQAEPPLNVRRELLQTVFDKINANRAAFSEHLAASAGIPKRKQH